ncbi:MAG: EpsI family protein [Chloroflexi bacterium]|nr:EpsI family protein [Chloroflexota bacterium]
MSQIKPYRFYILYVLLALAAVYVLTRSEAAIPVNKPFELFPQKIGEWRMVGQARFDKQVLDVLKPTDYLSRTYMSEDGHQLTLYIGYHDGGPLSGPIHSPKQCLPGSGWNRLQDEVRSVEVNGKQIPYVSASYQKETEKQLFLYWFQVREQILTNEYALKLATAKNAILNNRRDSSFVRLSIPATENEDLARQKGAQFIQAFFPAISETLPH